MDTPVETLIKALRHLADDIQSADGVANACVAEAADRISRDREEIATLQKVYKDSDRENTVMLGLLSKIGKKCHHCGIDDMSKCKSGFPGCALADDMIIGEDEVWKRTRARVKRLEEAGDELICYLRHRIKTHDSDEIFHGASIRWGKVKKEAKP